jgi:DNA-binding response OmpR family regulator
MPSANTILIIDDEQNLRQSLAAILQKAGYSVTAVGHPLEALQSLTAGPYDLVFLDLQLPDMDGLKLLAEMHQQYPEMPVLILTAHGSLQSSIEAVRSGARDYLLKPIDPPLILARVHEVLAERQQSQRRREIVAQIQGLLAELGQIDGEDAPPTHLLSALPPTASTRFLQRGPFTLDLHARHATLDGRLITLPSVAFDYLVTLARHAPNPVPHEALVMQSQGYDLSRAEAQEMTRWRIHQLRQALEPDLDRPQYILSVRGIGYRLAA